MKSFFIISAYWTGSGRSSPKSCRTAFSVCWSALRPAMRAAGSTPGVAKKIRNDEHADREQHEHHRDEPPRDEAEHQRPAVS